LADILTNAILWLGLGFCTMVLGWIGARAQLQGRIDRAVAQCKTRMEAQQQRQVQRLRESHADLENQVKDVTERLERRENMMRGMEVADVRALREELRQAKEEIGHLRASGAAVVVSQLATPLRPSSFQDFVADPQVPAQAQQAQARRPQQAAR
jgi:uncharacterized protein YlxW (UPF0749 family)